MVRPSASRRLTSAAAEPERAGQAWSARRRGCHTPPTQADVPMERKRARSPTHQQSSSDGALSIGGRPAGRGTLWNRWWDEEGGVAPSGLVSARAARARKRPRRRGFRRDAISATSSPRADGPRRATHDNPSRMAEWSVVPGLSILEFSTTTTTAKPTCPRPRPCRRRCRLSAQHSSECALCSPAFLLLLLVSSLLQPPPPPTCPPACRLTSTMRPGRVRCCAVCSTTSPPLDASSVRFRDLPLSCAT